MNRRSIIKSFLIISVGATILPSCFQDNEKSPVPLKNIKINGKEVEMLSELSETIIPKTDTPGAKDIGAHLFVLMMVDDCLNKEKQEKFVKGLQQFEEIAVKKAGKNFAKCNAAERTAMLRSMEVKTEVPENVGFFYDTLKSLTIQAFTTSEYFLTKVQVYKLVPGKFYGCVPVKKTNQ